MQAELTTNTPVGVSAIGTARPIPGLLGRFRESNLVRFTLCSKSLSVEYQRFVKHYIQIIKQQFCQFVFVQYVLNSSELISFCMIIVFYWTRLVGTGFTAQYRCHPE